MSKRYTEGIAGDGAAILDNGVQITISEILNRLNEADNLVKESDSLLCVSALLLSETIYLLRKNQPNNCPDWIEGIGDCKKDSCEFCRTEKCIDAIESNVR